MCGARVHNAWQGLRELRRIQLWCITVGVYQWKKKTIEKLDSMQNVVTTNWALPFGQKRRFSERVGSLNGDYVEGENERGGAQRGKENKSGCGLSEEERRTISLLTTVDKLTTNSTNMDAILKGVHIPSQT